MVERFQKIKRLSATGQWVDMFAEPPTVSVWQSGEDYIEGDIVLVANGSAFAPWMATSIITNSVDIGAENWSKVYHDAFDEGLSVLADGISVAGDSQFTDNVDVTGGLEVSGGGLIGALALGEGQIIAESGTRQLQQDAFGFQAVDAGVSVPLHLQRLGGPVYMNQSDGFLRLNVDGNQVQAENVLGDPTTLFLQPNGETTQLDGPLAVHVPGTQEGVRIDGAAPGGADAAFPDGGYVIIDNGAQRRMHIDANDIVVWGYDGTPHQLQLQKNGGHVEMAGGTVVAESDGNQVFGLYPVTTDAGNPTRPYLAIFGGSDGERKMYVGYPSTSDDAVSVVADDGDLLVRSTSGSVLVQGTGGWAFNNAGSALDCQSSSSIHYLRSNDSVLNEMVRHATATDPAYPDGRTGLKSAYTYETTNAANCRFSGSNGYIQRSTSTGDNKTEIEDVEEEYAEGLLDGLRPRWFRSKLPGDVVPGEEGTLITQVGFIAEECAEVDERLVGRDMDPTITGIDESGQEWEAPNPNYGKPIDVNERMILGVLTDRMKRMKARLLAQQEEITTMKGQMLSMHQRLKAVEEAA